MAAIDWDDSYAVGVADIDAQHRALFLRINELSEALIAGAGKEALGPMLRFLGEYVVMHFGTEQRLMQQYGYPRLATHRQEHEGFVKTYGEARDRFDREGSTKALAATVSCNVCQWLLTHVLGSDRKLGQFLRDKGCR